MVNVAQTLADVGPRQLFNSINNKQRIIFGFQREGDIAFIDVKSLLCFNSDSMIEFL